jgi:hypothetical protein
MLDMSSTHLDPKPLRADDEPSPPPARNLRRALAYWLVVAAGLGIGLVIGAVTALVSGLIDIC